MVETAMGEKETSAQKSIVVQNRSRLQPVSFRIPGRTIRLGPGEKTALPNICDCSDEYRKLIRDDAIVRLMPQNEAKSARSGETVTAPRAPQTKPAGASDEQSTAIEKTDTAERDVGKPGQKHAARQLKQSEPVEGSDRQSTATKKSGKPKLKEDE